MRCALNVRFAGAGLALLLALTFAFGTAVGQQATVATPFHSLGDSFFENIGVGWGFRGKGFNVQFGGPTMAAPPFGGFNPGAGANVGFGFGSGGFFNGNFSQGSQRSFVSQVPSMTVTNGVPGYMAVGTVRPFVVSYVPVVGGFPAIPAVFLPEPAPMAPLYSSGAGADAVRQALRQAAAQPDQDFPRAIAPRPPAAPPAREVVPRPAPPPDRSTDAADSPARRLALAQESTAGRPAPSVAEAKRLHAVEEASLQAEARVFYERGLSAQQAGNLGAAKVYYQMAARRASGDFRREVLQCLQTLASSSKAPSK